MNRSRLLFLSLSFLLVLPLITFSLTAKDGEEGEGEPDSLFKHLSVFTDVLGLIRSAYVEVPEDPVLMAGALDGATDALDPFSVYVPAADVEAYSEARRVGYRRSGLVLLRERGVVFVVGVVEGSPAAEAGVRPGDVVSAIQGEETRLTPLWAVQRVLTGEPGSEVRLKVLRAGTTEEKVFKLRDFVAPGPVLRDVDGVAILKLHYVNARTREEVEPILTRLADSQDKLLLDLRGVAGGDAEAAYRVASLFTDGELGVLRNKEGDLVTFRGAPPKWHGRLAVLIDRGTLGAAEVLVAVLHQKLGAELVGEPTFGFAGRVRRIPLNAGGDLWLTDAFYTGPDREPLNESQEPEVRVASRRRDLTPAPEAAEGAAEKEPEEDAAVREGVKLLLEEKVEEEDAQQVA
jgi:carboxyl-terminal processing protease